MPRRFRWWALLVASVASYACWSGFSFQISASASSRPPSALSATSGSFPPPPPPLSEETGERAMKSARPPIRSSRRRRPAPFSRGNQARRRSVPRPPEHALRPVPAPPDRPPVRKKDLLTRTKTEIAMNRTPDFSTLSGDPGSPCSRSS